MANYHLEVSIISRRKGRSVVKSVNYISGRKLHDHYNNKTYYSARFFFRIKLHPNFIIYKTFVMKLTKQKHDMMPAPHVNSKAHCQMNYLFTNKNKLFMNLSVTTLLLMAYAQLPLSMKVETKQIQNRIILTSTSLCQPGLLIKTALI